MYRNHNHVQLLVCPCPGFREITGSAVSILTGIFFFLVTFQTKNRKTRLKKFQDLQVIPINSFKT